MKNIVITGASTYGVKNMGDDAMLATLTQGLKKHFPNCNITFLARHPSIEYDKAFGFNSIQNLDHNHKEKSIGRDFNGFNAGDSSEHLLQIKETMDEADLFILGGNSFMEVSENHFLHGVSSYAATLCILAKFCNTPFSLFGLNIVGGINSPLTLEHAKFICNNANSVTLREKSAFNYLKTYGVNMENCHILGDPAFGIEPSLNKKDALKIISKENISFSKKPIVGVNFRHEYWLKSDQFIKDQSALLAKQLDQLTEKIDCQFLFIPNCTYQKANPWQDDRIVHPLVVNEMKFKDRAFSIKGDYNVFETLALFELLDMHISNRRHSSIFAALNYIPFLPLSVSLDGHMLPFLEDLGIKDQLASLAEPEEIFFKKLLNTWENKKDISNTLKTTIPPLKASAQKYVDLLIKGIM